MALSWVVFEYDCDVIDINGCVVIDRQACQEVCISMI